MSPEYCDREGPYPPPDYRQRQPAAFPARSVCCSPLGMSGAQCSFGRREHRNR